MKVATMYPYRKPRVPEDDVWFPGQVVGIHFVVCEAEVVNNLADGHLRTSVPRSDAAHVEAPLLWGQHICHRITACAMAELSIRLTSLRH
jgi:hypothetical protein